MTYTTKTLGKDNSFSNVTFHSETGDIEIGNANLICDGVIIYGPIKIGDNNKILPNTVIGCPPALRSTDHTNFRDGMIEIGNNNIIREGVAIQKPMKDGLTSIGNDCCIWTTCLIPHDAKIEDGVTMANGVCLGGHVRVMKHATIGFNCSAHQYTTIGSYSMIGMNTVIAKDIPPFVKAFGNPMRFKGYNKVGMKIHKIEKPLESELKRFMEIRDKKREVLKFEFPFTR